MKMENGPQRHLFTAAQIAAALRVAKRTVLKWIEGRTPSGILIANGQDANAWEFGALPVELQERVTKEAQARNCRGAVDLLLLPVTRWESPRPLAEIRQDFLNKAHQLKRAFQPMFERIGSAGIPDEEFAQLGVDSYRRVFGYSISIRHWQRLWTRILERDRGLEEWERLELYLDEAAFQSNPPAALANGLDQSEIGDQLAPITTSEPSAEQKVFLWDATFRFFERNIADGAKESTLKQALVQYLQGRFPGLSKSESALKRVFELKLAAWRQGGRTPKAIRDGRETRSGFWRRPEFKEDRAKLIRESVLFGGNVSLAQRQLRKRGDLSAEYVDYYSSWNIRKNKSDVPDSIREDVKAPVLAAGREHRGPRFAKLEGPYIPRDWSGVAPGDYFSADDVTWNHYVWDVDQNGSPYVFRPECLVFNDLRCGYILELNLIAGKYNGRHIRKIFTRVHDQHGLPRLGLYFERGVWKCRLIEGRKRAHGEECRWEEMELGLRERGLNLDVRHATTPRAKPIEGIFHILQDRQRQEPGFVGFNERLQKQEYAQEYIQKVKSGKEHPGNQLLHFDEWAKRLSELAEEFNAEPQNGKMNPGISPQEAWAESVNQRPLTKLPAEARYIVASHKRVETVKSDGIKLTFGRDTYLYHNEELAALEGRKVLAFFDLECAEVLTVSDMDRHNWFSLSGTVLPAMNATSEQLAAAQKAAGGFRAFGKSIYGNIRHSVVSTVTFDKRYDPEAKDLGRHHNEAVEAHRSEKKAASASLSKAERLGRQIGLEVPPAARNDATRAQKAARLMEILSDAEQKP